MIILGIDTSCDETSVSVLQGQKVIAHKISSQVRAQREWGGVVPMLAQRMHTERIEFVITDALVTAATKLGWDEEVIQLLRDTKKKLHVMLDNHTFDNRADSLPNKTNHTVNFKKKQRSFRDDSVNRTSLNLQYLSKIKNPGIDLIAVTIGPGLAPALKVGLQAAKILVESWDTKFSPINHMEGHLWSGLLQHSRGEYYAKSANRLNSIHSVETLQKLPYPFLAALISGGHTELILVKAFGQYEVIGETLDDAAGEAFDKFSVMLNLGYPGGAVIERLAEQISNRAELDLAKANFPLPIPMRTHPGLNFSFSGLKTAAMYLLREKAGAMNPSNLKQDDNLSTTSLSASELAQFAASFQFSVVESIRSKVSRAIEMHKPAILLTGGGVINNKVLRSSLLKLSSNRGVKVIFPNKKFLIDNGAMIGLVGYFNSLTNRDIFTAREVQENPLLTDRLPSLIIDSPTIPGA